MKTPYKTELTIITVGILVGIILTFVNALYVLILMFGIFAIAAISSLVLMVGFITKSRIKNIGLACLISMFLIVGTYIGLSRLIEIRRQHVAGTVISDLETYKVKTGVYPSDLKEIDADRRLKILRYRPSPKRDSYTVSYLMNGCHRTIFNSKTGQWTAMQ